MARVKRYCPYCEYFHGDKESTFILVKDSVVYGTDRKGRKSVGANCKRCGGFEFVWVGGRSVGGSAARGVWKIAKGTARGAGAVIGGTYKAGKWAYDKATEDDDDAGASSWVAFEPESSDGDAPPAIPGEALSYDGYDDFDSEPPAIPDSALLDEPPTVPIELYGEIASDLDNQIDDLAEGSAASGDAEDPYGDRPEEHRISWSDREPQADDARNAIDDTPMEDDPDPEPMPHEGPPAELQSGVKEIVPSQEQIVTGDTEWRQQNYGKVSQTEWDAHESEVRQQLRARKQLDLEAAGGRIDYGDGEYAELLDDGSIKEVRHTQHGADSTSSYERIERPDLSSQSKARASEKSEHGEFEQETTVDYDGDASHTIAAKTSGHSGTGPPALSEEVERLLDK